MCTYEQLNCCMYITKKQVTKILLCFKKKKSISLFNKKDVYRINDVLYTIYAMSCWNEKHKIVCKTVSLTLFHEFSNIRAACQFCHRYEGHTLIKSPGVTQVWMECWATFRPVWIVNPVKSKKYHVQNRNKNSHVYKTCPQRHTCTWCLFFHNRGCL